MVVRRGVEKINTGGGDNVSKPNIDILSDTLKYFGTTSKKRPHLIHHHPESRSVQLKPSNTFSLTFSPDSDQAKGSVTEEK